MAAQNRSIVGSVLKGGRFYKAGEEAALAKILSRKDVDRLVKAGVLTGEWQGDSPTSTKEAGTPSTPSPTSTESGSSGAGDEDVVNDPPADGSSVPLSDLSWGDLRALAKALGVKASGARADIEAAVAAKQAEPTSTAAEE